MWEQQPGSDLYTMDGQGGQPAGAGNMFGLAQMGLGMMGRAQGQAPKMGGLLGRVGGGGRMPQQMMSAQLDPRQSQLAQLLAMRQQMMASGGLMGRR